MNFSSSLSINSISSLIMIQSLTVGTNSIRNLSMVTILNLMLKLNLNLFQIRVEVVTKGVHSPDDS